MQPLPVNTATLLVRAITAIIAYVATVTAISIVNYNEIFLLSWRFNCHSAGVHHTTHTAHITHKQRSGRISSFSTKEEVHRLSILLRVLNWLSKSSVSNIYTFMHIFKYVVLQVAEIEARHQVLHQAALAALIATSPTGTSAGTSADNSAHVSVINSAQQSEMPSPHPQTSLAQVCCRWHAYLQQPTQHLYTISAVCMHISFHGGDFFAYNPNA